MEKKKVLSGSVQEKGGKLYAVIGYTDPITEKRKTKWIGLDLPISSGWRMCEYTSNAQTQYHVPKIKLIEFLCGEGMKKKPEWQKTILLFVKKNGSSYFLVFE